jgi:hypothetical protein
MAPRAYLQTVAAITTSGDIVDPRKFGILPSTQSKNNVARGLYRLPTQGAMEAIPGDEEVGHSRQLFRDTIVNVMWK